MAASKDWHFSRGNSVYAYSPFRSVIIASIKMARFFGFPKMIVLSIFIPPVFKLIKMKYAENT